MSRESPDEVRRYRVTVRGITRQAAISPKGRLCMEVRFHVEPLDNGIPYDGAYPLMDESLDRALRLQSAGAAEVTVTQEWVAAQRSDWREKVIELALAEFVASE